jgi:L-lactate dehydrogenase
MALLKRGTAREIVLVNRDKRRAMAVATDMRYGVPALSTLDIHEGSYTDLAGADLVLITAGVNEKGGGATDKNDPEGRLRLLDANASVYREIVPEIVRTAPDSVIMVVTDPPDPLADLTRQLADHDRVFSAGTVIDTFRFRTHIAKRLGVNTDSVYAIVIGEHGTSEVLLWSSVRVGKLSFDEACAQAGESADLVRHGIEDDLRNANITITEGNNASQYGIGNVCARLAQEVLPRRLWPHSLTPERPRAGRSVALVRARNVRERGGRISALHPAAEDCLSANCRVEQELTLSMKLLLLGKFILGAELRKARLETRNTFRFQQF